MIGAIVVTLVVYTIVVSFLVVANRMLRSDENWIDPTAVQPAAAAVTVKSASPAGMRLQTARA
jgi:predicted LPLAT superfamily acyltransferase